MARMPTAPKPPPRHSNIRSGSFAPLQAPAPRQGFSPLNHLMGYELAPPTGFRRGRKAGQDARQPVGSRLPYACFAAGNSFRSQARQGPRPAPRQGFSPLRVLGRNPKTLPGTRLCPYRQRTARAASGLPGRAFTRRIPPPLTFCEAIVLRLLRILPGAGFFLRAQAMGVTLPVPLCFPAR